MTLYIVQLEQNGKEVKSMLQELEIRLSILDNRSAAHNPKSPLVHSVEKTSKGYRLISTNIYGFEEILYNSRTQTELIKYIDTLIG